MANSRQRKCPRRRFLAGFTLIELLVFIVILVFIVNIAFIFLQQAREDARLKGALQFAQQVHDSFGATEKVRWTFDNIIGATVNDESGNGNDGEIKGNPMLVEGVLGQALFFDGDGDYIERLLPSSWGNEPFTITLWAKADGTQVVSAGLFSSSEDSTSIGSLQIDVGGNGICNNQYRFRGKTSGGDEVNPCFGAVNDKWHFLVAVYDGNKTVTVYFDGHYHNADTPDGTYTYPGFFDRYRVGRNRHPSAHRDFKGIIDEVNVYREALSTASIERLYTEGIARHRVA